MRFRRMRVRRRERYVAVKLLGFRRTGQRCGGRIATGNHLRDFIEIACAHKALVRHRAIAQLLRSEFFLLQF